MAMPIELSSLQDRDFVQQQRNRGVGFGSLLAHYFFVGLHFLFCFGTPSPAQKNLQDKCLWVLAVDHDFVISFQVTS
jgi:hypothetical protein